MAVIQVIKRVLIINFNYVNYDCDLINFNSHDIIIIENLNKTVMNTHQIRRQTNHL